MTIWNPFRVLLAGAILVLAGACGQDEPPATENVKDPNIPDTIGEIYQKYDAARDAAKEAGAHLPVDNNQKWQAVIRFMNAADHRKDALKPSPPYKPLNARPRWHREEVPIYLSPDIVCDTEALNELLNKISGAIGVRLTLIIGQPDETADKDGIYIDPFGYVVQSDMSQSIYSGGKYVDDPQYGIWPKNLPFPHCRLDFLRPNLALRCLNLGFFAQSFIGFYGSAKDFWASSVMFLPEERFAVDGFFSSEKDGDIFFAQCWIPVTQEQEVRDGLMQECIVRALGLPNAKQFTGNSVLSGRSRYKVCNAGNEPCKSEKYNYGRMIYLSDSAKASGFPVTLAKPEFDLLKELYADNYNLMGI